MGEYDIRLQDEGTIVLLHGVSPEGYDWLETSLQDPTRWGRSFVVEARYVGDILKGAVEAGLAVTA